MKTRRLLSRLGKMFPKKCGDPHDFLGLMAGKLPEEVNSVLLVLDFDEFVYNEMKIRDINPDLIIAHHPFIYGKKKSVFAYDPGRERLCKRLEDDGIALYAMHTNFDHAKGGMNDALVEQLELRNAIAEPGVLFMRGGELPFEMSFEEAANYIKEKLQISYVKVVKGNNRPIKKVAIIGGGGSSFLRKAHERGYDLFISGDIPHYLRRECLRLGFNYVDAPHEIERIFMTSMKRILNEMDSSIEVNIIDHEEEPDIL